MPKIKEITEVHSGVTFRKNKSNAGQAYPFIQLSDLDEYYRLTNRNLDRTQRVQPKNRHLLSSGDIIFSSKGEYNFATVIPEGLGPAIAVSTFLVLKNIIKGVLPEYLAWFINSKNGQDYLAKIRKKTSIPYISKSSFVEMPVPVPPLEKQKLITRIEALKIKELELRQKLTEQRRKLIDAALIDHINKKAPAGR